MVFAGTKQTQSHVYRRRPAQPAPGEVGTLNQQLAAIGDFLTLQRDDPLLGPARLRRWQVVQALHAGTAITSYQGGRHHG